MSADRVRIFDTTLRDGEQAPGCSMTLRDKLRVAKALSELNVDIIEAGFPAASPGDFESVKAIADENFGPVICGLARCNPNDIEKVHAAVRGSAASNTRIRSHQRHPPRAQAQDGQGRDHKERGGRDHDGPGTLRRRRVLSGGCIADRAVLPGRGGVGSYRGRRDNRKYSRYGRV